MAKPKVLLVDADLKSQQLLEISLKKAGYIVTSVPTGEQALELVETFSPNLILADVELGGALDGYGLCHALKEKPTTKPIPLIFITRRSSVEDKVHGLELGAEDYLTKPIYLKEILARIRRVLERGKSQPEAQPSSTQDLFQGTLSQMSVVDLLQTMELSGKTAIIHLEHRNHQAKIFVRKGKVIHATCDHLLGERAAYRTFMWNEGRFRIEFVQNLTVQETILTSTQGLIMEGMRRVDELLRFREHLPPFDSYLAVDSHTILEEHPERFPAKIENVLAAFDGNTTLEDAISRLTYDELESLEIISKLYFLGYLVEVPSPVEEKKSEPAPPFELAPPLEGEPSTPPPPPPSPPLPPPPPPPSPPPPVVVASPLPTPPSRPPAPIPLSSTRPTPLLLKQPVPVPPKPEESPPKKEPSPPLQEKPAKKNRKWIWVGISTFLFTLFSSGIGYYFVVVRHSAHEPSEREDPLLLTERAEKLLNEDQWASASRLAEKVLETDPTFPRALYIKGSALESLGKKQDALESYEKAVNLDPGFTPARLALLRLKTTLTSFDPRALKEIETLLLSLDPTHYPREYREALFLKLNLEIQGNQPEAVNTLKLLREVAPQDPRLPLLASQVPSQQPPPPPSPAILPKESPLPTRTLKLTEKKESKKIPPSEELRQKAREQKAKGYLLPAKKTLEEALALTPNNDEILVDLGELSMELGDTARAGQLFVQAGKLNPKNPRVYLNLGSLYVIQGDRERARKAYELYLRYAPPDAPERPEVERSLRRLQTP